MDSLRRPDIDNKNPSQNYWLGFVFKLANQLRNKST